MIFSFRILPWSDFSWWYFDFRRKQKGHHSGKPVSYLDVGFMCLSFNLKKGEPDRMNNYGLFQFLIRIGK